MVHVMLHINSTHTAEYFPYFEIIYTAEIFFILVFYALAPVALYVLWHARPFHRNLRLSMCNLVLQGLLGTTARLIFVYNQYLGEGPYEERPSVIVATILRLSMLEAFTGVFVIFSVERFIATFAWSWYEKTSPLTIVVFVVQESCAVLWSWGWAIAVAFEYVQPTDLMIGMACSLIVGCSIGLVVIAENYRETMKMKVGARINQYSVARAFQIRENVGIMKALFKMAFGAMVLNVPLFVLGLWQLFLSSFFERMIARALFDFIISLYPAVIITLIPLSDVIFERSLRRMPFGERLFSAIAFLQWRGWKKTKIVANVTDHYFGMLAASLNGPPVTRPHSTNSGPVTRTQTPDIKRSQTSML